MRVSCGVLFCDSVILEYGEEGTTGCCEDWDKPPASKEREGRSQAVS